MILIRRLCDKNLTTQHKFKQKSTNENINKKK